MSLRDAYIITLIMLTGSAFGVTLFCSFQLLVTDKEIWAVWAKRSGYTTVFLVCCLALLTLILVWVTAFGG